MYKVIGEDIITGKFKVLCRIADLSAALCYAMTVDGSVVVQKGDEVVGRYYWGFAV